MARHRYRGPDIITRVGTFSRVGSYSTLSGRDISEFNSVVNSSRLGTVDKGVRRVPRSALVPRPIDVLKDLRVEFTQATTNANVCFRDACQQNAGGMVFVDNGVERALADDSRGIPLRVGDSSFVVRELRIDDDRR